MNPWQNFLNLLGWGALAVLIVVIGILIYVMIMVLWGLLRNVRPRKNARYPTDLPLEQAAEHLDDFMQEVIATANLMYAKPSEQKAFQDGARMAWGYFSRR